MDHACFPRYTCLDIQKCTKFKRLSHYLIRCVHRADFHFMEAYVLYYSYTQYWTHSSKGYLVHGPCFPRYTCLDIRKCTKFKRLSHYLIRCVHRADFHFMEAYGLYYSYTQYWTHSSKGYLVHGPCFPRYTSLDIWKCTKFQAIITLPNPLRPQGWFPFCGSPWSVLLVHPILDP